MARRYEGLLEVWPTQHLLYVRELPGFYVSGSTRNEVIDAVLNRLDVHLAWLEYQGYASPLPPESGLFVAEEMRAIGKKTGPRFAADLIAPSTEEIESALAIGRDSLSEIIDTIDDLERSGAGGARRDRIVKHVTEQETWYASRLSPRQEPIRASEIVDRLVAAAGRFEDAIDAAVESTGPSLLMGEGEEWTIAKALRRRTVHLREHLIELLVLEAAGERT